MIQHLSNRLPKQKISGPATERSGPEIFFSSKPPRRARIVLVASIAWTLWNYRLSLIRALEAEGYEVLLMAAEDASCHLLQQHTNARFFPLRQLSRRSLSPIQNLKALWEMFRTFRHIRPDGVLFFTIRPNTLGNLAAAMAGIPGISTLEGMGISGSSRTWLRGLTRILYRLALRHTSKVVFLNQEDRAEFLRHRMVPASKTLLVPGPGIDAQHFAPRVNQNPSGKTVFLFVGRLLSEKGVREFAEAANLLKNKGLPAIFRVLGSTDPGNPTTISSAEMDRWVQNGVLEHLGFHNDVRPALAECDVLVLPSYYREGVPRSVLEAMAMGKPIITTDNVGCRDTVENGQNGLLVPPRSAAALADAMEKLLALSPERRTAMGLRSRQKALAEFGDDRVVPRYLDLIRDLLRS